MFTKVKCNSKERGAISQVVADGRDNMAERGALTLLAFGATVALLLLFDFMPVGGTVKEAPAMKFNNLMGPSLRFLYCYS